MSYYLILEFALMKRPLLAISLFFAVSGAFGHGLHGQTLAPSTPSVESLEPTQSAQAIRRSAQTLISQLNYKDAASVIYTLPKKDLTEADVNLFDRLNIVVMVDESEDASAKIIQGDDDLLPEDQETIKRLYRESQKAFLTNQDDLSKDLLVQIIYINRRHFKAKQFLKLAFSLDTGDYQVEDKQTKFWDQSSVFFYGGNYERAVGVLKILAVFDPKNPEVYERMGSSAYMMGQKKEALEAWTTALFLKPDNKTLQHVVAQTEKLLEKEKEEARLLREERRKRQAATTTTTTATDTQLLGVFATQPQAYSYAQKLKEEKLNPIVEQLDNGKWSVSVPKSQMGQKETK